MGPRLFHAAVSSNADSFQRRERGTKGEEKRRKHEKTKKHKNKREKRKGRLRTSQQSNAG
jgi:hypothetical protein